ncbi:hypothetical protein Ancab_030307 [Ancistrocladus abbreviatus]
MEAQEGNSSDIRRPETEVGSANASNTSNFIEDFNDVPSNQGDFDHSAIDPSVRPSKKGAVRVMAKDLIRTRHQIEKFYKLKSQLQGVALRIQNERMELTSEVMGGDAIDDALEGDKEEEETEELVNQVLDEIGIDVNQELVNAPSSAVAAPTAKTKVAQAKVTGNEDSGMINCCTRG